METVIAQAFATGSPIALALAYFAHRVDKRLTVIEFHLFDHKPKKEK